MIHNQQSLTEHLSAALEKLCEPVLPEYIDDSNGPDLTGRNMVWQMGMIAWNIHVTARQELADCAFAGSKLDAEQQKMVQDEIAGLVQRKIELYPRQMTAIRDVAAMLVNGSPRAKARPGDTFPELPAKNASEPEESITAEDIAALRKEMKLTQTKFGELLGVSARKASEWEHGKRVPDESSQIKLCDLQKKIANNWFQEEFRYKMGSHAPTYKSKQTIPENKLKEIFYSIKQEILQ